MTSPVGFASQSKAYTMNWQITEPWPDTAAIRTASASWEKIEQENIWY